MRAAAAGGAGPWLRRLLVLAAAATATAAGSTAHMMAGGAAAAADASVREADGVTPAAVSLPTLMAGVEGLSPPCQKGAWGSWLVVGDWMDGLVGWDDEGGCLTPSLHPSESNPDTHPNPNPHTHVKLNNNVQQRCSPWRRASR